MKLSILIPCYKEEDLVGPCLDSILQQNASGWEAVCTDDGSPDATGEVLDEYVRKNCEDVCVTYVLQDGEKKRVISGVVPNKGAIKVIHQKNSGLSGARNAALRISTGDWLMYLDGDDLLSPFALESMEQCLQRYPDVEMMKGGMVRFLVGDTPRWGKKTTEVRFYDFSGCIRREAWEGGFQRNVYRRSAVADIDWVGLNWGEERQYTVKCLTRVNKLLVTPTNWYGYCDRPGSVTKVGMSLAQAKNFQDVIHLTLRLWSESGRVIDSALIREMLTARMEWCLENDLCEVRKESRKDALRYWFDSLQDLKSYRSMTTLWRRFTIAICHALPVLPVAYVLCYIPHRLKRLGLHRKISK